MRRFVRTPPNVRVLALGLAVLAHVFVFVLLVIERRMQHGEADPELRMFVSLWPEPEPPPRATPPPRELPGRSVSTVPETAPLIVPQELVATPTPVEVQSVVPDPVVVPPPNWNRAAQDAADLYMANHTEPDIEGAVVSGPRKPCRPPPISKELQAKIDKQLDRRPDPRPPVTSPPGSVMMGGQRVGVITLGGPLRKRKVEAIPPEVIRGERKSSVPDANRCDPQSD